MRYLEVNMSGFHLQCKKKRWEYTPYRNTHSTLNRNVEQQMKCFTSNCSCSYCAKQMYKFSLSPKAKPLELSEDTKSGSWCTALCGKCSKEHFLTALESTSEEMVASVSRSGKRNELLLRILWQVIWSTKGDSRLYQEWGNHSHLHKSILAGKDYKCNKRVVWREMLPVPIKEDSDCVVRVLHKILQVRRKGRNWVERWVQSNLLYFCWKLVGWKRESAAGSLSDFISFYEQQILVTVPDGTQQDGPFLQFSRDMFCISS